MSSVISAFIAIALGAIVAWATRNVERRPPTWVVGLTVAVVVFPIAFIGFSIAHSASEDGVPGQVSKRVFIADADTGESRVLLEKRAYYSDCAWSPDGATIALPGNRVSEHRSGIVLVDPDAGDSEVITLEDSAPQEVAWSADGDRMAWWEAKFEGGFTSGEMIDRLVVADADGGDRRELLARDDFGVEAPQWSPDGTQLAFSSWETSDVITLVDARDGSTRRLPTGAGSIRDFAWSPDGQWIAVTGFAAAGPGVQVVAANGSTAGQVASWSADEVVWSPDGDRVAAADSDLEKTDILTVAPDGTSQTRLATLPAPAVGHLTWSADGTKLALWAYLRERPEIVVIDAATGDWESVATIYSEDAVARESPAGGPLKLLDRLLRGFSPSSGSGTLPPDMAVSYSDPPGFSWGPDSRQIAYISGDPGDEPPRDMTGPFDFPIILFFGLAAPVALIASIWAWVREGTSVLTVLCTLASILPTLGCLAVVAMFVFGIMMAASFMLR